jgi:hypothetical protein
MASEKHTPILERDRRSGSQRVYRFPNGYGASVISGEFAYGHEDGLVELGVLKFDGNDYDLTYDTPITDDVIGHLTEEQVQKTLDQIAALPTPNNH